MLIKILFIFCELLRAIILNLSGFASLREVEWLNSYACSMHGLHYRSLDGGSCKIGGASTVANKKIWFFVCHCVRLALSL